MLVRPNKLSGETKQDKHVPSTKPIHYLEFQTKLIDLQNKAAETKPSTQAIFTLLSRRRGLFEKIDDEHTQTRVIWPHRNAHRTIHIVTSQPDEAQKKTEIGSLHFYDQQEFLSCTITINNEIIVTQPAVKSDIAKQWNMREKHELVSNFNEMFKAKIVYQDNKMPNEYIQLKKPGTSVMSKETIDQLINQYKFHSINYKFNNVLAAIAQEDKHEFTFRINWPDSQRHFHLLEARFTRCMSMNRDTTHFANERTLLATLPEFKDYSLHIGQYYYNFKLFEVVPPKKSDRKAEPIKTPVLNLSMTSDGSFGELCDVDKGKFLSGNEVLNLYQYFDNLFQIKTTVLCDASRLNNDDYSAVIFLRVLSAIVTDKTWYENKIPGLTLFECDHFKSVYFKNMSQNQARRTRALHELQELPLHKWHAMLDSKQQQTLTDLYRSYVESKPIPNDTKLTLKDLTTKVYESAKLKKQITPDLMSIMKLLYDDMPNNYYKLPDEKAADYFVKARTYELLWGSYYWMKRRSDDKESQKCTYSM